MRSKSTGIKQPRKQLRNKGASDLRKKAMEEVLNNAGVKWVAEHMGIPGRRFRFDWCVPDLNLALEYEGLGFKSRHTNPVGYTNDCRKYNLAALNGWTVLRYTSINYKEFEKELKRFIENKQDGTGN